MNIYEKLQKIRVALLFKDIKKGGKNTYSNYAYYELADFLPEIMKLMEEHKMTSVVTFTKELATLTLIDQEKPDAHIVFTSPMAGANLKAAHEIQNLGAVETYQRRYLYMVAFEIVEADMLDITQDKAGPLPAQQTPNNVFVVDYKCNPYTEIERLWNFAQWNPADLPGYIQSWAARNNIGQPNDTAYASLLKELTGYLSQIGMQIEELPF